MFTLKSKYRNDDTLKICNRQVRTFTHFSKNHEKMSHCKFHTSQYDHYLQNIEIVYKVNLFDKMMDVLKLCFQVTKTLQIYITKP